MDIYNKWFAHLALSHKPLIKESLYTVSAVDFIKEMQLMTYHQWILLDDEEADHILNIMMVLTSD